jgi:hypothetical protein
VHVAVRDALLARNRSGGVGGRRLELVSLDSWDDPDTLRGRAEELIADPLVLAAIVGVGAPPRAGEAASVDATLSALAEAGLATATLAGAGAARATTDELLGSLEAADGATRRVRAGPA